MKKLIGYLLMKDLPNIEKGALFERIGKDEAYRRRVVLKEEQQFTYSYLDTQRKINCVYPQQDVENNPKWFKPVYK